MRFILFAVETTAWTDFFNSASSLSEFLSDVLCAILSTVREVTIIVERYDLYCFLRVLSKYSSFDDSDVCLLIADDEAFDASDAFDII